jgi:protein gp37
VSRTTTIEWTRGPNGERGATWNPTRGCSRVSPGCENCYAERQAARFSGEYRHDPGEADVRPGPYHGLAVMTPAGPRWTGEVRLVPELLDWPLRRRKPLRIFVNSMSDLFHERLTNAQIAAVWGVMAADQRHTFLVLTKRARRMREWFEWLEHAAAALVGIFRYDPIEWRRGHILRAAAQRAGVALRSSVVETWPLPNAHLGVSVEDQQRVEERIPRLLNCPAAVRWVSAEPLLGPIDLVPYFHGLDWVVTGGESGPGARPCDLRWIRSIVRQCDVGVPVFVKQLGDNTWDLPIQAGIATYPHRLRLLDRKGGDPAEWPEDLRVREYPL